MKIVLFLLLLVASFVNAGAITNISVNDYEIANDEELFIYKVEVYLPYMEGVDAKFTSASSNLFSLIEIDNTYQDYIHLKNEPDPLDYAWYARKLSFQAKDSSEVIGLFWNPSGLISFDFEINCTDEYHATLYPDLISEYVSSFYVRKIWSMGTDDEYNEYMTPEPAALSMIALGAIGIIRKRR